MDIVLLLALLALPILFWRAWVGLKMPKRRAERETRRRKLRNRPQ